MSTPAPLTTHDLEHHAPVDSDDRVLSVTFRPSGFTPSAATDLVDEWAEATRADSADHRPAGWRAWQMRRAYRDLQVTVEIGKGGQP